MTECNRCGGCCDPVHLGDDAYAILTGPAFTIDPRDDLAPWEAAGYTLPTAIDLYDTARWAAQLEHRDEGGYTCPRFDPTTRLCTMPDDKPPVCRDFPWYSGDPATYAWRLRGLDECSYWEDVPVTIRQQEGRP